MVERERILEVAVSLFVVFTMIGVMLYIGSAHGEENGALSSEGGEVLVIAIIGFIFLVTAVGVVLAFVTNEPGEADAESDAETSSAA